MGKRQKSLGIAPGHLGDNPDGVFGSGMGVAEPAGFILRTGSSG